MKTDVRYQNGFLYEHHGAWYVRYHQRTSKEDGTRQLNHASKHLGRSKDFRNISGVELCRASFMQTINRDRLSANSRITLTAFVEGAYLPWTKEERRASTSKGHHEIWINHRKVPPISSLLLRCRSPRRFRLQTSPHQRNAGHIWLRSQAVSGVIHFAMNIASRSRDLNSAAAT